MIVVSVMKVGKVHINAFSELVESETVAMWWGRLERELCANQYFLKPASGIFLDLGNDKR